MPATKKRKRPVVYAKPPEHPHADLDPNVQRAWGVKTFRATLGVWKYRAYVEFEIGGNCLGLGSLSMDMVSSVWDALPKAKDDDDCAVFDMVAPDGDVLQQDQCTEDDLEDILIGIELVALRPEKRKEQT
jgi:hypothetical protein